MGPFRNNFNEIWNQSQAMIFYKFTLVSCPPKSSLAKYLRISFLFSKLRSNRQISLIDPVMAHRDVIVTVMLSFCLLASFVQGSTTKVTYCDKKGNYDVTVKGLEITPYPVARGKPATFSILATTGETLSGGKVLIEVSLFGVHIHSETHELCSETSCPVSAGDFVIAHSQVLPGYTPPGSYSLKMKIVDENNHQLTCIGFQFSIGLGSDSDVASI